MKTLLSLFLALLAFGCTTQKNNQEVNTGTKIYYAEQYRPQFHFSPESGWMNDPNGMVYYEGEYHLFYQHYPDSTIWGPMHWGHAVSTDLIHWEHLPVALTPDENGYIFSGSAVVDRENTSGLGKDGQPPLIAVFTYHDPVGEKEGNIDYQTQGIAYSNDKGRTWTKYGEPVLKNPGIRDFRDPKVMWFNESKKWIMSLAVKDHIEFYSSANLIDWHKESEFGKNLGAHGGVWECPDLFEMKVQGTNERKWVLLVSINPGGPNGGSATQYFVGDFDGSKFTTEQTETKWLDNGRDNYAGVTWSNIPEADGRRLFLGWMSNWNYAELVPTEKWRSATTIPRELILEKVNEQFVIVSIPVTELKKIRNEKVEMPAQVIAGSVGLETENMELMNSEMKLNFSLKQNGQTSAAETFGIILKNNLGEYFKIGYSTPENIFYTDRTKGGINSFSENFAGLHTANYEAGETMNIHLFIDEASVEVFVDGGELVFTDIVFPTESYDKVELFSTKGSIELIEAEAWSLNSTW
ncbi:glycoside hydrolase family 32 protein [Draconibacterium orientale]|uniref:glycoside hydrolase family 32 protein n=1 Tax=Draconibacterium orientale TaxID=1168034 RepID=UPI002A0A84E5|nr:glycoside hydrolase family 32 protein [Draconibacterium orientale]